MAQEKDTPSLRDLQCMAMQVKILTRALDVSLDIPEAEDLSQQLVDKIYTLARQLDEALDHAAGCEP